MWFQKRFQQRLLERFEKLIHQGEKIMSILSDVRAQVAGLQADVAAESTVVASAITLINGFSAQLAAAISAAQGAGLDPADLAAFQALHDSVVKDTAALGSAVAANTPSAPPAPTPLAAA